MNNYTRNVG